MGLKHNKRNTKKKTNQSKDKIRSKSEEKDQKRQKQKSDKSNEKLEMKTKIEYQTEGKNEKHHKQEYNEGLKDRVVSKERETDMKSIENEKLYEKETKSDNKCPICFDQIQDLSKTDCCGHKFCFRCLFRWSSEHNVCPICRNRFHNIIHNIRSEDVYDSVPVEDRDLEQKHDNNLMNEMQTDFNPLFAPQFGPNLFHNFGFGFENFALQMPAVDEEFKGRTGSQYLNALTKDRPQRQTQREVFDNNHNEVENEYFVPQNENHFNDRNVLDYRTRKGPEYQHKSYQNYGNHYDYGRTSRTPEDYDYGFKDFNQYRPRNPSNYSKRRDLPFGSRQRPVHYDYTYGKYPNYHKNRDQIDDENDWENFKDRNHFNDRNHYKY